MSKLPDISLAELRPMIRKARKHTAAIIQPEVRARPTYSCPELGRTCTRPNAYDAFDLPSIYAGERRPYRFSQDQE